MYRGVDIMDKKEMYEAQFMQLVMSLQGSAWMMLGKVMNPMTGKVEKDLEAAKATIDALLMLSEKTEGNLSKDEKEFLNNSIQELQMNYMDEAKSEKAKSESKQEEKAKKKVSVEKETDEKKIRKEEK